METIIEKIIDHSFAIYGPLVIATLNLRFNFFDYLKQNEGVTIEQISQEKGLNINSLKAVIPLLKNQELVEEKRKKFFINKKFKKEISEKGLDNILLFYNLRDRQKIHSVADLMIKDWLADGILLPYDNKEYSWVKSLEKKVSTEEFTRILDIRGAYLAEHIKENEVFKNYRNMLDIGGASGIYPSVICNTNPGLLGTVFDLESVIEETKKHIEKREDKNLNVLAGNMFSEIPKGYDIHFYSNVMHNWNKENIKKLLRNSYESLNKGEVVAIHDRILNRNKSGPKGVVDHSLLLSLFCEGGHYTLKEYSDMMREIGFENIQYQKSAMNYALITGERN